MEQFVVVAECIIEHNKKFLLIKRPPGVHAAGLLAFPGGKVDYADGDNRQDILVQAVQREVLEEVGLNLVDPILYVTSCYFTDSRGTQVLDTIFYTKLIQTPVDIIPSLREVPEYYWMSLEEILEHKNAPPWLIQYLLKAMEI